MTNKTWRRVILVRIIKQNSKLKIFPPITIPLLLTLIFTLLAINFAKATAAGALGPASQQIGDLQNRSQELDESYRQALADLVAVDSEVSRYSREIDITTKRQAEIQTSIEEEQRHLDETKQQLNEQEATLEKRLRGIYKSDDVTLLSVMLGADDFSDFLTRVDALQTIAESDRQLINSINESKKSLEEKINSLAAKQQELAKILESLNAAQQNLIAAKEQQQSVVNSLQAQKLANEGQLAQLQSEAAGIEARMNQLQSQSANNGDGNDYNPPPAGGTSFTMVASAYCLAGRTATGMPVGRGIIAVDPSVIPLGTRVHVSGYGDAIAADTGGAISGNRIDVWLPCDEAYAWGVRTVTVTIY